MIRSGPRGCSSGRRSFTTIKARGANIRALGRSTTGFQRSFAYPLRAGQLELSGRGSRSYLREGGPSCKEEHLAAAAAVLPPAGSALALAAASEPAAGSSFKELLEADPSFADMCSSSFRAANAAKVQNGSAPWLLRSDCGLGWCAGSFIDEVIHSARSRPALAGVLDMVPCDLFKTIQGRTLWILGDRSVAFLSFFCGLPLYAIGVHGLPARRL